MNRFFCALALSSALTLSQPTLAQTVSLKIAPDLAVQVSGVAGVDTTWLKMMDGQPMVKVLIASSSTDPSLAALRAAVLASGGSVHYVYLSTRGLSGVVPLTALSTLAARADVLSITPNRVT